MYTPIKELDDYEHQKIEKNYAENIKKTADQKRRLQLKKAV